MELKFNKSEEGWVAEFKVTSSFSLHIEGVVEGNVKVYQRSTPSGEYAYTREGTPSTSYGKVYDFTFPVLVGPKFMKVVCVTEPTYGEVVTDGEVAFDGEGGETEEPDELAVFYYNYGSDDEYYVPLSEIDKQTIIHFSVQHLPNNTIEISGFLNSGSYKMAIYGNIVSSQRDVDSVATEYPYSMMKNRLEGGVYEKKLTLELASGMTVILKNENAN